MTKRSPPGKSLSRRRFFRIAGGATVAAAGMGVLPNPFKKLLSPVGIAEAQAQSFPPPNLFYAGTDGWISLPKSPTITSDLGLVHPDNLAPDARFSTYIFGFRNVTGLDDIQRADQKNKAQHTAPMFWVDQFNGGNEFRMQLTNLGLALRPDLFDAHTIHWHGFRNVIPFFDGEPGASSSTSTVRVTPVPTCFTATWKTSSTSTWA
jgi:hypothetical protein